MSINMENYSGKKKYKRNSMHKEHGFDESGYASFHGSHNSRNSTLESFSSSLIFDPNRENSINLSNTSHLRRSITPFSYNKFIAPKKESSRIQQCAVDLALNETGNYTLDDENLTPPVATHLRTASKRHKPNYQKHYHSSPKKSKKNLFPVTPVTGRTHYFNGVERLDIIGMLDTLPMLDVILNQLDAQTLDSMTQVSRCWQQIVYKSKRSAERLHVYHMKLRLTKENVHMSTVKKIRASSNSKTVPFKDSNSATFPGLIRRHIPINNESDDIAAKLLMDGRRVRCPRCGKSSKVLKAQNPKVIRDPFVTRTIPSPALSSDRRGQFSRVFSFDSSQRTRCTTPPVGDNDASYGECTGAGCKFKFCLHCSCEFHPGGKCPVTELGTPSKILMQSNDDSTTPPKCSRVTASKLSRKKSLKRLCF